MANCFKCGKPVIKNSPRQIVYWHKECRTEGRRLAHRRLKGKL